MGRRSQQKNGGKSSNADKKKVDEKREYDKKFTVAIDTPPSVSLIQLYNMTDGMDGGTG